MASMPKPIADYWLNLTLRALNVLSAPSDQPDPLVQGVRLYDYPSVEHAFVVDFIHPDQMSVSSLHVFPLDAGAELTDFDSLAKSEPRVLPLITEPLEQLQRLRYVLKVLESNPLDIRRFMIPMAFSGAKDAMASAMEVRAQQDAPVQEPIVQEIEVTFAALALDILCGAALRENAESSTRAAYAVWADPNDQYATLILRNFDKSQAVAIAAYSCGPQSEVFADSVFELEDYLVAAYRGAPDSRMILDVVSGLRLLGEVEACERLGRVLAMHAKPEGLLYQPGIAGVPSYETAKRLRLFEEVAKASDANAEAAKSDGPSAFEVLAAIYLSTSTQYYSQHKEDLLQERIEVLENNKFPGSLVLVSFDEGAVTPDVAVYGADGSDEAMDALCDAVNEMLASRRFGSYAPRRLPVSGPFQHVAIERTHPLLQSCLLSLGKGEGLAVGFPSDILRASYEEATAALLAEQREHADLAGASPRRPKSKLH
jgi:hypothetical protein